MIASFTTFRFSRSSRQFLAVAFLSCIIFVTALWYTRQPGKLSYFTQQAPKQRKNPAIGFKVNAASLKAVRNSTLGFQKVFVINLSERPDKLDAFSLVSSLTGFETGIIQGVKGEYISDKSLPATEGLNKDKSRRDNEVGCWRAHLDFARKIVDERLSSALVLEDDADWDTGFKDQMEVFARGSQFVTAVSPDKRPHSPYGDDWDLLWLGHCGSQIMPNDDRRFVIQNDSTVPAPQRRANFFTIPDMAREGYDNNTRVVYRANGGCCLYAYALSYRGARRLLRAQATRKTFAPIDLGINEMCKNDPDFKCIGVFPQIVDSHKGPGPINRDSDISAFNPAEVRQRGFTFNIVHSVRLNLDRLLAGQKTGFERQWPEDPEIVGPPQMKPMGRVVE